MLHIVEYDKNNVIGETSVEAFCGDFLIHVPLSIGFKRNQPKLCQSCLKAYDERQDFKEEVCIIRKS